MRPQVHRGFNGQRLGAFIPFLDYDIEIRKVLCSTDEIVNRSASYHVARQSSRQPMNGLMTKFDTELREARG